MFKHQHRGVRRSWQLPSSFPNPLVIAAYEAPRVDRNKSRFTFGKPDLQLLRTFCRWAAACCCSAAARCLVLPVCMLLPA